MPVPSFDIIRSDLAGDSRMVANELAKFQKEVQYLLTKGLDTDNVLELNAEVINAGILNAGLVTVRSDLTGSAYIQIDSNGLVANDGTINTFEIDINGNAYFRGDITSEATITGALIQTATEGRRLVLSGSTLSAYDTNTLDGFTLDGADGDLKYYSAGVQMGGIFKDTSSKLEFLLISHDNGVSISSLSTGFVELSAGTVNIGEIGGNMYVVCDVEFDGDVIFDGNVTFNGNVDFSGATVSGLSFSDSGTTEPGGADGHTHTFSVSGSVN